MGTLIKNTGNSAIIRPVIGTNKTAVVSPQQQKVQVASNSPRVISLKRPYSAITCASSDINEPNIVKLSGTTQFQVLPHIATEHIKIEEEDEEDSELSDSPANVRKRANLDHMTPEEKMMRRKLKNRVAAQNARDKKRVKMDDMEDRIKRLEDENKRILEQNQKLMEFNRRLTEQNERLTGNDSTQEPKTIIKVEPQTFEETDLSQNRVLYVPPMSPESLPRSPSPSSISSTTMTHHQRLSSLDDESAISLNGSVSTDSSDVSSLVEQRSFAPAEPIHVPQQQEQDRRLAGEETCKSQETITNRLLDPSTAALFMTCLMTTVLPVINNLSPQDKKIATTTTPSMEPLEPLDYSKLPPKKRMSHVAVHHPKEKERALQLPT